ncbi:hypothetical protein IFM89_033990 [Coptis chinensis]|uniref:Uncharacterized protein n=1 Tax=Coptis chinensis TaxID=261450 RepID=A0A835IRZ5_9MAGN|nr:hypothetical protein IFM89_033990 [Coptis chinensis]
MVLLIPDLMKSQLRTLQLFEFKLHFGDTKVAAPLETLGKAVAELQKNKPTYIGMDSEFEWGEVEAFVRRLDGSLFNWYIHSKLVLFCLCVFGWSVCWVFATCYSLGVLCCCLRHGLLLCFGVGVALGVVSLLCHGLLGASLLLVFVFLEAEYATPQNSLNQFGCNYNLDSHHDHFCSLLLSSPSLLFGSMGSARLVSQESLRYGYGRLPAGLVMLVLRPGLTMMWTLMWFCGTKFIFIEVVASCDVWDNTHGFGEPNISYICSRYYRARELIFGAIEYTTTIDMWSIWMCLNLSFSLGQVCVLIDLIKKGQKVISFLLCIACNLVHNINFNGNLMD